MTEAELLSDKEVLELQKQWDPALYKDEPNEMYKELMTAICEIRFNESVEDHRKYLMEVASG